ncbi:MAG TPA: adenylate/guanylate cyclase domain-containing protein [Casimicrobiaceae bacterium]|nr:adenylate/guanylate cyclase domain-containing protein [Casimicrobiaceae bacterium]
MAIARKLVAVVMADVVGYSRLMERDEAGTHDRLRKLRAELLDPRIAGHGGRIVKTTGDGMLLEFPSATAALRCAVEIQREMGARNRDVAADERIEFRTGVNVGDVIVDGDDIIGDGVNVAARLEPLAAPGGICVAAAVREQVREDLGVGFVDAGKQRVKNISRPVHVYRVALGDGLDQEPPKAAGARRWSALPPAARGAILGAAALLVIAVAAVVVWRSQQPKTDNVALRSFLVAPFATDQGDPALSALAAQLTTGVTKTLGDSMRWARIVAAGPVARQAGPQPDPKALGRAANVRYVLEGDMHPEAAQLAFTLRVFDARDGTQLQSLHRVLNRPKENDPQETVHQLTSLARGMLWTAVTGIESKPGEGASPPDAITLLARIGGLDSNADPAGSTLEVRRLLDAAIEIDPKLGRAWALRAGFWLSTFFDEFDDSFGDDREKVLSDAEADSSRAVALDPDDAQGWYARGRVLAYRGNVDAARAAFDHVREMDSSRYAPITFRAWVAQVAGEPQESLQILEQVRKDWGRSFLRDGMACAAHLDLAAYDVAIAECERAAAATDDDWGLWATLAAAYALHGDAAKATHAREKLLKTLPNFTIGRYVARGFRPTPKGIALDEAHFVAGLRTAGVPE